MTNIQQTKSLKGAILPACLLLCAIGFAQADDHGLLEKIHRHTMRTSTISDNGDLNPYALIVAPVSSGKIQQGDVIIDNFNNLSNLQGTGTTIVDFNPATKKTFTLAKLPNQLPGVKGGVGLTTAMAMLKSGFLIVGSLPSTDGTMRTHSESALIVLDTNGQFISAWTGPNINGPWGNIAVIDNGTTASLFVSMAAADVPGPQVRDEQGFPVKIKKATVVRFDLEIAAGKPPEIKKQTIIADGLESQANKDSFLVGPTGLALAADGTLYVSDGVENRVIAIPDAAKRETSAGAGKTITSGGLLKRPLAMTMTLAGHLLVCNALNGQVVEIDPAAGKQLYAQWIDTDQAQQPPGNGDLFGIAMTPDGKGFYYVEDDMNTLMEAR